MLKISNFKGKTIFSLTSKIAGFAIFLMLILVSCSKSYSGKEYVAGNSGLYIKFINSNKIEWKWDRQFGPEEMEYTIEDNKIRAVRTLLGSGQVVYLEILDGDRLRDSKENTYLEE